MPTLDPHGGTLNFVKYRAYRADIDGFLKHLFGCHLICDCRLNQHHCHAHHLERLCLQMVQYEILIMVMTLVSHENQIIIHTTRMMILMMKRYIENYQPLVGLK